MIPKTLFDARVDPGVIWVEVNKDLRRENPNYLSAHGEVGSLKWWGKIDAGEIPTQVTEGIITFFGQDTDEFNETLDIFKIRTSESEELVCHWCGYFQDPEIQIGRFVRIKTVDILVSERLGPHIYSIDYHVEVAEKKQPE